MHTIAIIKASESYENLSIGFKDVFADINQLAKNPEITIGAVDYETIFYLCSDYKVTMYVLNKGNNNNYNTNYVCADAFDTPWAESSKCITRMCVV